MHTITRKIKGSTLIEVIVSLIIIMILSGMVTVIILNIQNSYKLDAKVESYVYMNNAMNQIKANKQPIHTDFTICQIELEENQQFIRNDLKKYNITVNYNSGKQAFYRELITRR